METAIFNLRKSNCKSCVGGTKVHTDCKCYWSSFLQIVNHKISYPFNIVFFMCWVFFNQGHSADLFVRYLFFDRLTKKNIHVIRH